MEIVKFYNLLYYIKYNEIGRDKIFNDFIQSTEILRNGTDYQKHIMILRK